MTHNVVAGLATTEYIFMEKLFTIDLENEKNRLRK